MALRHAAASRDAAREVAAALHGLAEVAEAEATLLLAEWDSSLARAKPLVSAAKRMGQELERAQESESVLTARLRDLQDRVRPAQ